MVPNLVTIAEAREQLKLDSESDGGPDDAWLDLFISGVSNAIADWVKEDWRLYQSEVDSDGDVVVDSDGNPVIATDSDGPIVLPNVRSACLIELSTQYEFRSGDGPRMESLGAVAFSAAHGFILGQGATSFLTGRRKPTLA